MLNITFDNQTLFHRLYTNSTDLAAVHGIGLESEKYIAYIIKEDPFADCFFKEG